ncbi:conserved membrane hypothetical protein [Paraburkholderia unamae]|uniref:hypothetical protein n=1 Tax=Paraburkholderia unamae TaxID=219649 RepID=UPI001CB39D99|nr:hypothetical protein [Paraburkholderia unamae]CAG9260748.1 conserved membrane hypothetical protein [Paraburkholderia unamae]
MPDLLAGDLAWLGAGALFAWLGCAFAQLAALAPVRSRRSHAAPRCAQRAGAPHKRRFGFAISFALLLTVPPGVLAAGCSHATQAAVAVEAGVLAGLYIAGRRDLTRRARTAALAGGALGAAALTGGFASCLLEPGRAPFERAALFIAVATGALLVGGALSLLGRGPVRRRVPFGRGDRAIHLLALLLGVALGYGFVSARASADFELSVLVAASVLAAALGARLMSGARKPRPVRTGAQPRASLEPFGATFNASFAGVPDELLVAACGSGAFEPAWLAPGDASPGGAGRSGQHASQDLPRRRRSRHGALRQRQGPH